MCVYALWVNSSHTKTRLTTLIRHCLKIKSQTCWTNIIKQNVWIIEKLKFPSKISHHVPNWINIMPMWPVQLELNVSKLSGESPLWLYVSSHLQFNCLPLTWALLMFSQGPRGNEAGDSTFCQLGEIVVIIHSQWGAQARLLGELIPTYRNTFEQQLA